MVAKCDHFAAMRSSHVLPYVFTEQGVAMLASVLKSDTAVKVSIQIMDAFVAMRRFISANAGLFQRVENLEEHQIATDEKVDFWLHIIILEQILQAKILYSPYALC